MQLLVASPAVAACSRFVIETARADALAAISPSAAASALSASDLWRRRCASATRRLTLCQQQGVYYELRPPLQAHSQGCGGSYHFDETLPDGTPAVYVTPWCVAVDRARRRMYDLRLCAHKAHRLTTSQVPAAYLARAAAKLQSPFSAPVA